MPAIAGALPCIALLAGPLAAGEADVLAADVTCKPAPGGRAASVCQFAVTVKHADSGWDHYANRYDIVDESGEVLASRVLRHPHLEEQPFRRSIGAVRVDARVKAITVRANDLVHGLGGAEVTVEIPHAAAGKQSEEGDRK